MPLKKTHSERPRRLNEGFHAVRGSCEQQTHLVCSHALVGPPRGLRRTRFRASAPSLYLVRSRCAPRCVALARRWSGRRGRTACARLELRNIGCSLQLVLNGRDKEKKKSTSTPPRNSAVGSGAADQMSRGQSGGGKGGGGGRGGKGGEKKGRRGKGKRESSKVDAKKVHF